jgi:hypothetical protein
MSYVWHYPPLPGADVSTLGNERVEVKDCYYVQSVGARLVCARPQPRQLKCVLCPVWSFTFLGHSYGLSYRR